MRPVSPRVCVLLPRVCVLCPPRVRPAGWIRVGPAATTGFRDSGRDTRELSAKHVHPPKIPVHSRDAPCVRPVSPRVCVLLPLVCVLLPLVCVLLPLVCVLLPLVCFLYPRACASCAPRASVLFPPRVRPAGWIRVGPAATTSLRDRGRDTRELSAKHVPSPKIPVHSRDAPCVRPSPARVRPVSPCVCVLLPRVCVLC